MILVVSIKLQINPKAIKAKAAKALRLNFFFRNSAAKYPARGPETSTKGREESKPPILIYLYMACLATMVLMVK